ncbi:MAG: hypothetical protein ACE5IR_27225 [bacterium]
MTNLLQQAINKVNQLSPSEQDAVAAKLLQEVSDIEALKEKIALGTKQCDAGEVVDGDKVFAKLRDKAHTYDAKMQSK